MCSAQTHLLCIGSKRREVNDHRPCHEAFRNHLVGCAAVLVPKDGKIRWLISTLQPRKAVGGEERSFWYCLSFLGP